MKVCNKCFLEKDDIFFNKKQYACKLCQKEYNKNYQLNNRSLVKELKITWNKSNRSKIRASKKTPLAKSIRNLQLSNRRKNDSLFRLKQSISRSIRRALKFEGGSKNGESTLKYLGYSLQELKSHIEIQFESWMNWNNQGKYIIETWNDDDPSTWTWQLDHIIPQSDLPYVSMSDDNFKKCWALINLRPLSSKQNLLKSNKVLRD